jgi:Calx-beta domain
MMRLVPICAAGSLLVSSLAVSRVAAAEGYDWATSDARACSSAAEIFIRLDKFAPDAYYEGSSGDPLLWKPYYWAVEGTNGTFRITRDSDDCDNQVSTADYDAENDTATNDEDFSLTAGKTKRLEDPFHGDPAESYQDISFPVHADGPAEPVVERAIVKLTGYDNAVAGNPFRAPFYFIDNQSAGFAFAEPSYGHSEFGPTMPIPVFRGGPATNSQPIAFTVTGSGPNPAVEGENFEVDSKSLTFAAGERVKVIDFSIMNNRKPDGNKTFSISLAGQATQNETEITIIDAGGDPPVKPHSRFHHPRQGLKYDRDDYRIREMHTFAFDNDGPEIEWAKLALRKKLRSGRCAWWHGKEFRGGKCSTKKWLQMERFGDFNGRLLYIYEVKKKLNPTQGTRVEKYTAFSRVGNIAGAKEIKLEKGRNVSNFKVMR